MKDGLKTDYFGNKRWYKDDLLHREDGQASSYNDGRKYWYKYGKFHRDNGPAIEYSIETALRFNCPQNSWYLYGELLPVKTQEEFKKYLKLKAFW